MYPIPTAKVVQYDEKTPLNPRALHVRIAREPFAPYFELVLDNGHSEELDPDETREWFRLRGANMEAIERALDYTWNFYKTEVYINNPKEPAMRNPKVQPRV